VIWLEEVAKKHRVGIIFFPKFHCELNFIEMCWGYIKAQLRRSCSFKFTELYEASLPNAIDNLPLPFVRRASRHRLRFMSGYRVGLQGPLLDFAMRAYKVHRMIPTVSDAAKEDLKKQYEKCLVRIGRAPTRTYTAPGTST
jgi:hypothetical protein